MVCISIRICVYARTVVTCGMHMYVCVAATSMHVCVAATSMYCMYMYARMCVLRVLQRGVVCIYRCVCVYCSEVCRCVRVCAYSSVLCTCMR